MVFIVGEAFVNLRSGQLREAVRLYRIDCLAILKQADDVVHGDAGAFHYGVPAPHARRADDVAICFGNRFHVEMVRFLITECQWAAPVSREVPFGGNVRPNCGRITRHSYKARNWATWTAKSQSGKRAFAPNSRCEMPLTETT